MVPVPCGSAWCCSARVMLIPLDRQDEEIAAMGRITSFAEICHEKERSREALLARIE